MFILHPFIYSQVWKFMSEKFGRKTFERKLDFHFDKVPRTTVEDLNYEDMISGKRSLSRSWLKIENCEQEEYWALNIGKVQTIVEYMFRKLAKTGKSLFYFLVEKLVGCIKNSAVDFWWSRKENRIMIFLVRLFPYLYDWMHLYYKWCRDKSNFITFTILWQSILGNLAVNRLISNTSRRAHAAPWITSWTFPWCISPSGNIIPGCAFNGFLAWLTATRQL